MGSAAWFDRWMARHQRLNPHAMWRAYEGGERDMVYAGWKSAFDDFRVTEHLAGLASEAMQRLDERPYPEHQLGWLVGRARLIEGGRRAEAERLRREAEKATARRDAERLDQIRAAWGAVVEADREAFRARAREAWPDLAKFARLIDVMARNLWADEVQEHITQEAGA